MSLCLEQTCIHPLASFKLIDKWFKSFTFQIILGANPIWNPEEEKVGSSHLKGINPLYVENDSEELSSDDDGDNVFIGVEDQDDFRQYKDRYDDVSLLNYVLSRYECYVSDHFQETLSTSSSGTGSSLNQSPYIIYREGLAQGSNFVDESEL